MANAWWSVTKNITPSLAIALTALGCSASSAGAGASTQDGGTDSGAAMDTGSLVDSGSTNDAALDAVSEAASDGPTTSDAGPVSFTPSNFTTGQISMALGSPQAVDTGGGANQCVVDTGDGTWSCTGPANPTPQFAQLTGTNGNVTVWVLASLNVQAGNLLTFTGEAPAILYVTGPVTIAGKVITRAGDTVDVNSPGSGATSNGTTGAGGGGFCGAGGSGFGATAGSGTGGATYGTPSLVPLVSGVSGGSPGGNQGGGALQITSTTSISVSTAGVVLAPGEGGGQDGTAGGGGGSGGALLLEAPMVTVAGVMAANGGGAGDANDLGNDSTGTAQAAGGGAGGGGSFGATVTGANGTNAGNALGGGGGGAGRIRLNTSSGTASLTGSVSPTAAACLTQGTLMP